MSRRGVWLVCALLALCALGSVAWAEGEGTNFMTRPSNLAGIRKVLGGLTALLGLVAVAFGQVALMLMAAAVAPARVARVAQVLRRGRWVAVLLGVASSVALILVVLGLGSLAQATGGITGILAAIVLGFLVWLAVIGLAGTAKLVGLRLLGDEAAAPSPWRTVGTGGLAVAGALLVPFFGWAYYAYLLCLAIGAATIALVSGSPMPLQAAEAAPAAREQAARDEPSAPGPSPGG